MVGTLSWMSLMGRRPFRMSVSCWVALPDVRRPSQLSGSGRVALPNVREWSGRSLRCLEMVGRPSRMTGRGGKPSRMSRRLCGYLGVVERPSWISGIGPAAPSGCPVGFAEI